MISKDLLNLINFSSYFFKSNVGPLPNNCIATVGGKKMLKKVDETWLTEDICEKAVCAFDTNGNAIIKKQREVCNAVCQPVSKSFRRELKTTS